MAKTRRITKRSGIIIDAIYAHWRPPGAGARTDQVFQETVTVGAKPLAMKFIADFHVHSKYSRATSKNLDLEHLYASAQIKGISVLGTGDFTHPAWWQEIKEKFDPAEEGLFTLKSNIARVCDERVPPACRRKVRFMLVTEISNIYKKNGRTRKNHNLVFMPDLDAAERFNRELDKIGNIRSDGRPILGLDARNLLEIVLDTSDAAYLVPAHVWTPWFSLLGSKSGFDTVTECFEDLSPHIFALETGLSSDPQMNWRVSGLDRYALMSNSDAHSPGKLGREANCFDTDLGFTAIRNALSGADPDGFEGTIEFFPEEGKYHIDGHRACNFRCLPEKTRSLNHRCPVCGKPLVVGVLYRVEELADRRQGDRPSLAKPFACLVPLEEILGEVFQVGSASKRVANAYARLIQRYGGEFDILRSTPREDLDRCGVGLLGEAVERMRTGAVHFDPGYDGVYGRVRIFAAQERNRLKGQASLFPSGKPSHGKSVCPDPQRPAAPQLSAICRKADDAETKPPSGPRILNDAQQQVVNHLQGPLLIAAGPGTGKTHTITSRMAVLIKDRQAAPENILAVTFTNKAAREMRSRLEADLPAGSELPTMTTFHGFCRALLLERQNGHRGGIVDDDGRAAVMADARRLVAGGENTAAMSAAAAVAAVVQAKQQLLTPRDDLRHLCPAGPSAHHLLSRIYDTYQDLLRLQNLFDFEDLIVETIRLLETDQAWRRRLQQRFVHIFVDEFQDINYGQYRLIRLIAPGEANLCVIGDPDQAIYGFRGSDVRYFKRFSEDYPAARIVRLNRNYRSTDTILQAAYQVAHARSNDHDERLRTFSRIEGLPAISIFEAPSARAEAVLIGKTIEQMVGGTGFHAVDFGKVRPEREESSFADFAVLFRTGEQGRLIADVMMQAGIPCQQVNRRAVRQQPVMSRLMAMLRILADQGSYMDLDQVAGLTAPAISRETLAIFKKWAYATRQPLHRALRTATRVPVTGLSLTRQQRLANLIRLIQILKADIAGRRVSDIIDDCLARTGLAGRAENEDLQALRSAAADVDKDLSSFVTDQCLQGDTDMYRADAEKVALMTLHASKGLEFSYVFIAGCEEGLVPFSGPGGLAGDPAEERRLFFVAMTRARQQLFLSWARKRTLFGASADRQRSSYVDDIEQHLKAFAANPGRKRVQQQLTLF